MSTWDALGTVLVIGGWITIAVAAAWPITAWLNKHLDK